MSDFMYKDIPVMTLKDERGVPNSIVKVLEPGLLPFALRQKKELTFSDVQKWLDSRKLPKTREGIEQQMTDYPKIFQSYRYMSLDDPFWIRRTQFNDWKKLNFYNRYYDTGFGDMIFTPYKAKTYTIKSDSSPDIMTGGVLRKCWRQDKENNSYLIKAGSVIFRHEPLSEVLASVFLEKLDLMPYVRYDLHIEGNTMCSKCRNFITPGEELITADRLFIDKPFDKKSSAYRQLTEIFKKYDIPGAEEYLDKVIFFDELVGNVNRSLKDLAFIYLPEKQAFKGPAPLFDNGCAFFTYNTVISLEDQSRLFSDISKDVFNRVLKNTDSVKALASDKGYQKIINNFPDITERTAAQLIQMLDERIDVYDRDKNIEKTKRRKKIKSFSQVNIASLSNINKELSKGSER